MKTREQVLDAVKQQNLKSECIDGRDFSRLSRFFPVSEWGEFGFELKEGCDAPKPKPWTKKEVMKQVASDVRFGIEKAIDMRGLSASFMYHVVNMWMWVLEDDELYDYDYYDYGLPFFEAVAEKYNIVTE